MHVPKLEVETIFYKTSSNIEQEIIKRQKIKNTTIFSFKY